MADTTNQYDEYLKKQRELGDHTESIHNVFIDSLDRFVISVGHFIAWFNILLIAAIILNVILRYGGRYLQQDLGIEMGCLFQFLRFRLLLDLPLVEQTDWLQ